MLPCESDHTAYHFLFEDGFTGGAAGEDKTYPPELAERIAPLLKRPDDLGAADLARYIDVAPEELEQEFEAERAAPEFVLTYQYRSNVAYLMGDREAAVAALEKALEIEPDNALFRANLERLMAGD